MSSTEIGALLSEYHLGYLPLTTPSLNRPCWSVSEFHFVAFYNEASIEIIC